MEVINVIKVFIINDVIEVAKVIILWKLLKFI